MPAGLQVSVNNILLEDPTAEEDVTPTLFLNDDAENQGTLEVRGVIEGSGRLNIGASNGQVALPIGTVILNGDNTFTGRVIVNRSNIVLGHDNALGLGNYKQGNPSNQFGFNLISDDDSRTIALPMQMAQWQTVRGDHALEWAGDVVQTNSRGWINLLRKGKTLTLSGKQFAVSGDDFERTFTYDGTGTTLVTGGLHNHPDNPAAEGSHRKRGTGVLVVSGASTYSGATIVDAGTLRFEDAQAYGQTNEILLTGGAAGVDTGTFSDTDFTFLVNPDSTGGLIVTPGEATDEIDLEFLGLSYVSLAGPDSGVDFTGTIIPAEDTYRLGGGAGSISLPNDNQLTGDSSVIATNGGTVRVLGQNNYTGATRIEGKYTITEQFRAEADERNGTSNAHFVPTTLSISQLPNGGVDSGLGRSSSDAENLKIQGGTLRYEGSGQSTDRLFTIGTAGATVDASGSGPIVFSNDAPVDLAVPVSRNGSIRGAIRDTLFLDSTEDLLIGMSIEGLDAIEPNTQISEIIDNTRVRMSNPVPDNLFLIEQGTVSFTSIERTLHLTGTNTDKNVLTPIIPDAVDAPVAVEKSGPGTWVLQGDNPYTGTTVVSAGTLHVNGQHTGDGVLTVETNGTLGGLGFIAADVIVAGQLLASESVLTISGDVIFEEGGSLLVDLTDLATDTPLLDLENLNLNANDSLGVVASTSASPGNYLLATYAGNLSGVIDSVATGYRLDYDTPGQIILSVLGDVLRGDFNGDSIVDVADIDLLTPAIASGSNDQMFDLNGDAVLNAADLTVFLSDNVITAGNRVPGDVDLNGEVVFADFLQLSGNFGQPGVWSDGDFDADGQVAFSDFLALSQNFGSTGAANSVPEPGYGSGVFCLAILGLRRAGSRRRTS